MSKLTKSYFRLGGISRRLVKEMGWYDHAEVRDTVEAYHKADGYRTIRILANSKGLNLKEFEGKIAAEVEKINAEYGTRIYVERREFEDKWATIYGYIDITIWRK